MKDLKSNELMEIEGGVGAALAGAAAVVGIYAVIREVARDAGAAAAYKELGY